MTEKLLDIDSEETIRLSVNEAQALGENALRSVGLTSEEASIVATHLVDAARQRSCRPALPARRWGPIP